MTATIHLNDPQTLYQHWEEQQWSPWEIDLATDRAHWNERLGEDDKALLYWALSSLMVAEERITTKFAGLVMAGDSEEETTFLATQQVDEARHMQFYGRFQNEVVASPETIAAHVARARDQLGDSFSVIFDEALVKAHDRLVADPRDPVAKAEFVTTYHLVIEATLGLTAFEFITRYLDGQRMLPGFVEGYSRIHHDEQRHIGYGIWVLREAAKEARLADAIRGTLHALLPAVAEALAPPDSEGVDFEALGASGDEIRDFALTGLNRRLKVIGVEL
jgi:ribonucleoside-diphosphate reductase beta chain